MKYKNRFIILLIILFLGSCDLSQLRNKYSQNKEILNIYSGILIAKTRIKKVYNEGIELFLLTFSKKHKD